MVVKRISLTPGVPLEAPTPELYLYNDASDQGWGATLEGVQVSGLWSLEETVLYKPQRTSCYPEVSTSPQGEASGCNTSCLLKT